MYRSKAILYILISHQNEIAENILRKIVVGYIFMLRNLLGIESVEHSSRLFLALLTGLSNCSGAAE